MTQRLEHFFSPGPIASSWGADALKKYQLVPISSRMTKTNIVTCFRVYGFRVPAAKSVVQARRGKSIVHAASYYAKF